MQQSRQLNTQGQNKWVNLPKNQVLKDEIQFVNDIGLIVETEEEKVNLPKSDVRQNLMRSDTMKAKQD